MIVSCFVPLSIEKKNHLMSLHFQLFKSCKKKKKSSSWSLITLIAMFVVSLDLFLEITSSKCNEYCNLLSRVLIRKYNWCHLLRNILNVFHFHLCRVWARRSRQGIVKDHSNQPKWEIHCHWDAFYSVQLWTRFSHAIEWDKIGKRKKKLAE